MPTTPDDADLRTMWGIQTAPDEIPYIDLMSAEGASEIDPRIRSWLEDGLKEVYRALNETSLAGMPESYLQRLLQLSQMLQRQHPLTFLWLEGCQEVDLCEVHERSVGGVIAIDNTEFMARRTAYLDPRVYIKPVLENFLLRSLLMVAVYTLEPAFDDDDYMDLLIDEIAVWFFPVV